jgi:putative protease
MPLNLPLVTPAPTPPTWQGFRPIPGWTPAGEQPEPVEPQGEYAEPLAGGHMPWTVEHPIASHGVELLSPAGGPDAGFAALHHGADAIYLGLKKFSARAEAENFTLDEVNEITAYAHSLTPRRRVFVTINTVIRSDELPELVDDLHALSEIGVDALIVQDLGVWHVVRRHFPGLELHASTQLAVHNRAGAETLRHLGFQRVVLARELTIEEVHDITTAHSIETEVFIHGALCYSYSGLCLFSAQTLGRSGNRGKCAYSCRDSFTVAGAPTTLRDGAPTRRDPHTGFPFSMKDLALPDHIPALRAAGVSSFKIEGRKKSPLYVATTTKYYRDLLTGQLPTEDRPSRDAELQTVFSRPWTHLFTQSHKHKEVADRDTVGHRGTLIGTVQDIRHGRVTLVTQRPLEKHDGLQIDLPKLGKPFGFPIDRLWIIDRHRKREAFTAPAGARIEVELPGEYPDIPAGAPVYCSSSQAVKQKYRFDRPKAGLYRVRKSLNVRIAVQKQVITASAQCGNVAISASMPGSFTPAREPDRVASAVQEAFARLGDTEFALGGLQIDNPQQLFLPASVLNRLRREVIEKLQYEVKSEAQRRLEQVQQAVCRGVVGELTPAAHLRWNIKVDRCDYLEDLADRDWDEVDEVVIDISRDHPTTLIEQLKRWGDFLGPDKIRVALPAITRKWEERGLVAKIDKLRNNGWRKWEAANLSAWSFLGIDPHQPQTSGLDIATDWSVYVLNRAAAQAVMSIGASRFALSPEDGRANLQTLLREFPKQAVLIVYQDTPLFIAESCAYANLIGGCPGKANCSFESMEMESSYGEKVTALDYHCRTIVLNQGPFCLSNRLGELMRLGLRNVRADFIYRRYTPAEVRERWREVRRGRPVAGGHAANFDRGIL